MGAAQSPPQGAHYHADVMGAWGLWYSGLGLHQLASRLTLLIPRWATHLCILFQVCDARGASLQVKTGRSHARCSIFIVAQPVEFPLAVLCIALLALLPITLPLLSSALLSWLRIDVPGVCVHESPPFAANGIPLILSALACDCSQGCLRG